MKILLAPMFPNLKYLAEKLSTIFNVMEVPTLAFGSKNRLLFLWYVFRNQDLKSILSQALPQPTGKSVWVEGYLLPREDVPVIHPDKYILTPSIRRNLKDIGH
ncbi:unnamed protein product [Allacma fusca]|uniref:Uncharacterized protein n=1 Tax=Allacma fusca TaxID=39272 RepID=A0A8J2KNN6_9HEXA|nr:unnamed protein product [Allacma fusca]